MHTSGVCDTGVRAVMALSSALGLNMQGMSGKCIYFNTDTHSIGIQLRLKEQALLLPVYLAKILLARPAAIHAGTVDLSKISVVRGSAGEMLGFSFTSLCPCCRKTSRMASTSLTS